jgi:Rrf2 family protein
MPVLGVAACVRNPVARGERSSDMVFRQTALYALRALAALSQLGPAERLSVDQLADTTSTPKDYLSKVMRKLVVAGLVDARRGHGGGFALARPRREIAVADIFTALGEPLFDGSCAFGWSRCSDEDPCPLHPIWLQLTERVTEWAEGTSLCDATDDPDGCRTTT